VLVKKGDGGSTKDSYVVCDQIQTRDQRRFKAVYGTLSRDTMAEPDAALLVSFGLSSGLQKPRDPSEAN
jgi:mRNA-degrading endonuclease toxin of MazEF toxin-antitoxin module